MVLCISAKHCGPIGTWCSSIGTADQQQCNIKDAASNPVPSCPTVAKFMGEYVVCLRVGEFRIQRMWMGFVFS